MKPFVYIAGPYTSPDPIVNTKAACEVWDRLWDSGLVTPFCPHTESIVQHFHNPRPYKEWLRFDFEIIRRCDALLRMVGDSPGADREVELAMLIGIPVFFSEEALLLWVVSYNTETK